MHIIPRNKLSGAEKVCLLIAKNLKRYEVIVVCGGEELKNIFIEQGIKTYNLSFCNRDFVYTLKKLKDICKEEDIGVIHAHDNIASIYSFLVKKLMFNNIKIISHVHSVYPFLKNNSLFKIIDLYFRPKYDYNILCGKLVLNHYLEFTTYFPQNKYEILSNSIDLKTIEKYKLIPSHELRETYNIPNNKIVIGYCGRLCTIKGLIPFVYELSKNIDKFQNCIFLIVGNGELEDELKSLINKLKLEDKFIFVGFQQDTYPFYQMMDIFFLPSLYEGLPMVLLEAMAFEKTVVSMNVGGISELIKNKENGYLVESQNYDSFIKTLVFASNNYNKDSGLRQLAFSTIQDAYNITNYCEKLSDIYECLM